MYSKCLDVRLVLTTKRHQWRSTLNTTRSKTANKNWSYRACKKYRRQEMNGFANMMQWHDWWWLWALKHCLARYIDVSGSDVIPDGRRDMRFPILGHFRIYIQKWLHLRWNYQCITITLKLHWTTCGWQHSAIGRLVHFLISPGLASS